MGSDEEKARTPRKMDEEVVEEGFGGKQMRFWKKLCWEWRVGFTPIKMPTNDRRWHFVVTWDDWTPVITDPKEMEATADEESQRLRGPVKTLVITNILQASRWWMINIHIPAKKDQERLFDAIYDMDDAPKEMPDRSDDD